MIAYDKDEKTVHVARRHKLAFSLEIVFLIIAAILPYVFYTSPLFSRFFGIITISDSSFFLIMALYMLWIFFLWMLFFIAWSDYYLDLWIITDGRVIDVRQVSTFKREINSFRLDKITKLEVVRPKGLGKLINYGSLIVTTEGESGGFVIEEVPNPSKVRDMIKKEQKNNLERFKGNVEFLGE